MDAALVEILGRDEAGKAYALASRRGGSSEIPVSQLALMWVSAHMPRSADRILALPRTRYLGTAAA